MRLKTFPSFVMILLSIFLVATATFALVGAEVPTIPPLPDLPPLPANTNPDPVIDVPYAILWTNLENLAQTNADLEKVSGGHGYNGHAFSSASISNDGVFEFSVSENSLNAYVALSNEDGEGNLAFMDYNIYVEPSQVVVRYSNQNLYVDSRDVTSNANTFRFVVDNGFVHVKRLINGEWEKVYTYENKPTTSLYADVNMYSVGAKIINARLFNGEEEDLPGLSDQGSDVIPFGSFRGLYYDNKDFTDLAFSRTDAKIDFDWGTSSPDDSMNTDTFSVEWEGRFAFDGVYDFTLRPDDGMNIWIGNELVFSTWKDQPPTTYTFAKTLFGTYPVKVKYYENGGGAVAKLFWEKKQTDLGLEEIAREIVVRARGTPAGNVYPKMKVYSGNDLIGEVSVTSSYADYTFDFDGLPEKFLVQFTNDAVIGNDDRNMYVQSISVYDKTIPTSEAVYDRWDLDGADIIDTDNIMPWAGYLIFEVDAPEVSDGFLPPPEDPTLPPSPTGGDTIHIEAEDYTDFYDTTVGNTGKGCTADDVDKKEHPDGNCVIGWFAKDEWLEYDITVPTAGIYDLKMRVTRFTSRDNSKAHFEINGQDVSGAIPIPKTTAWDAFTILEFEGVELPAGTHKIRLINDVYYFDVDWFKFTLDEGTPSVDEPSIPEVPDLPPIPDDDTEVPDLPDLPVDSSGLHIEAEDYVNFYDTTTENIGGSCGTDAVDKKEYADGNCIIGWFAKGEWLEYNVNVPATGEYIVRMRISRSTDTTNSYAHFELDGQDVSGPMAIPKTSAWDQHTVVEFEGLVLTQGSHKLRLVNDVYYFDVDWFEFIPVDVVEQPSPEPSSTTITARLKGSVAGNVYPNVKIYADDNLVKGFSVTGSYKDYAYQYEGQPSIVRVMFTNDAVIDNQDRNLYVEKITINGDEYSPADATYDRGDYDGKDILSGRTILGWKGSLIWDIDGSGTTPAPTPSPKPTPTNCENVLTNSDFSSGTSPWIKYSDGDASFNRENNRAVFSISQAGSNVQLYQQGVNLEPNTQYHLSFDASSKLGRDMDVVIHKHVSPYTNYGLNQKVDLTTSMKSFSFDFTTKGFTSSVNDARMRFWFAPYDAANDVYTIDNVVLQKVSCSVSNPTPTPEPTPTPPPPDPVAPTSNCGDGTCSVDETCSSCSSDCGSCNTNDDLSGQTGGTTTDLNLYSGEVDIGGPLRQMPTITPGLQGKITYNPKLLGPQPGVNAPSGAVIIEPGNTDVGALVNSKPAGTKFFFKKGVHRNVHIRHYYLKDNMQFIGEHGAIWNPSIVLTGWTKSGSLWVKQHNVHTPKTYELSTKEDGTPTQCIKDHPRCDLWKDLYLNDFPLSHETTKSAVNKPGTWYYELHTGKIFMYDNPTGKTVELGNGFSAITTGEQTPVETRPKNVVVKNLIVEKYSTQEQRAAVRASGSGWVVENNEIRYNHASGLNIGSNGLVRNNIIHTNGQIGIKEGGKDTLVENNEIAYNNYAKYKWGWEAGGSKFADSTNLVVRNNYVHGNSGPGLWSDIRNGNTLYEYNIVDGNYGPGIFHEISYSGTIRYNLVRDNYYGHHGSGVRISTSGPVKVYGNEIIVRGPINNVGTHAFGISNDNRMSDYGKVEVYDNKVALRSTKSSAVTNWFKSEKQSSKDVVNNCDMFFDRNTYYIMNSDDGRVFAIPSLTSYYGSKGDLSHFRSFCGFAKNSRVIKSSNPAGELYK